MINTSESTLQRDIYLVENAKGTVLLSHGAGAGNRHTFMRSIADGLCEKGFNVVSINFPYMQQAYELDKKRPPNRVPQLVSYLEQELGHIVKNSALSAPYFVMGKSMGGRVSTLLSSQLADRTLNNNTELNDVVKATIVLGYPFMPPGKPEKLADRMSHFVSLSSPLLILQGERDTFGNMETLKGIELPQGIDLQWVVDGDHSFKPRKSSGKTEQQNIEQAVTQSVEYMEKVINGI